MKYQVTVVVHGVPDSIEVIAPTGTIACHMATEAIANLNGVSRHVVFITGVTEI